MATARASKATAKASRSKSASTRNAKATKVATKTVPKESPAVRAAKKPAAKKAAAKSVAKKTAKPAAPKPARKRIAYAQPLDAASAEKLAGLLTRARAERLAREASLSDVVVVHADSHLPPDSPEVQTVASLNLGNVAKMLGAVAEPGPAPHLDVMRGWGTSMAVRANQTALRMVRRSSPGLRIFSSAYLYPQYIRALGDELAAHALSVDPATQVTKVAVRLRDAAGQPIAGVNVQALLDWLGTHVEARTDATGVAIIGVPLTFPRVELIMVEADHTYWSQYAKGFDRAAATQTMDFTLQQLLPDGFKLMNNYADKDPEAGKGVRVGVIDSGVGPHADLTVAGGECFVTGEDATDFVDNGIGHGTHVAGIIAAKQSASGLYGLAPACILMSYRVCPKTGNKERALSVDVAAALERAIADQCDLVNISLGSVEAMPELPDVLEKARDAGIVVFASTGNDGKELLRYPARYSHTLAVGALGRDASFPAKNPEKFQQGSVRDGSEFVATFSNYGTGTDFIGVGVAVLSTYPNDRYAMMSGTSMATPFTTGMAARLLSRAPNLRTMARGVARVDAIVEMLCQETRKPGWPGKYGGFGVLK